jgi:hypothetical protein
MVDIKQDSALERAFLQRDQKFLRKVVTDSPFNVSMDSGEEGRLLDSHTYNLKTDYKHDITGLSTIRKYISDDVKTYEDIVQTHKESFYSQQNARTILVAEIARGIEYAIAGELDVVVSSCMREPSRSALFSYLYSVSPCNCIETNNSMDNGRIAHFTKVQNITMREDLQTASNKRSNTWRDILNVQLERKNKIAFANFINLQEYAHHLKFIEQGNYQNVDRITKAKADYDIALANEKKCNSRKLAVEDTINAKLGIYMLPDGSKCRSFDKQKSEKRKLLWKLLFGIIIGVIAGLSIYYENKTSAWLSFAFGGVWALADYLFDLCECTPRNCGWKCAFCFGYVTYDAHATQEDAEKSDVATMFTAHTCPCSAV